LKRIELKYGFLILAFSAMAFSCRSTEQEKEIRTNSVTEAVVLPSENPYAPRDLSPMDISYFPANYPMLRMKDKNATPPVARIIYSRPGKRGRMIFGSDENSLCRYGQPWRLGANESSEIEFFRAVTMGEKNISAGRYMIYCIPGEKEWDVRLNSDIYSWGLRIDSSLDVAGTKAPVMRSNTPLEDFTMVFIPVGEGMELLMAWDTVKVTIPFLF
jgi:hypothetical protein